MAEEKFVIKAPMMCDACNSLIVHGCGFKESDPWMALQFVASAALVQGALRDDRILERLPLVEDDKRDVTHVNPIFAEIGCLGCFVPEVRDAVITVVKRDGLGEGSRRVKECLVFG